MMRTLIESFPVIWPRSRLDADISICWLESGFQTQMTLEIIYELNVALLG